MKSSLKPDPQEMVRYFSDFLTEINLIISNIKEHAYEMVDVVIPTPNILTVYESMASIISSTHKTYDNLKRIESVMSGVTKSRRLEQHLPPAPTTPTNKCRSKSMHNDIFFYPRGSSKFNHSKQPLNWMGIDSRTIKKSKVVEDSCEEEAQSSKKSLEGDLKIKEMGQQLEKEEDQKTIRLVAERAKEQLSEQYRPLKDWKKVIAERINALICSNRSSMTKIMDRNMECIRLVRSVKKQIKPQR